jgi:hypothetical protein
MCRVVTALRTDTGRTIYCFFSDSLAPEGRIFAFAVDKNAWVFAARCGADTFQLFQQ